MPFESIACSFVVVKEGEGMGGVELDIAVSSPLAPIELLVEFELNRRNDGEGTAGPAAAPAAAVAPPSTDDPARRNLVGYNTLRIGKIRSFVLELVIPNGGLLNPPLPLSVLRWNEGDSSVKLVITLRSLLSP